MNTSVKQIESSVESLPLYREILLAVDSSDHSNRGVEDGIELANLSGARVTAAHVYAAQMHDLRFRQMEGGLPEKFREEEELERQRDVHDDLITRGLSIISESYLDQADRACKEVGLEYVRRALEGKNYRQMAAEANSGNYDLLVMGALGLGAVAESCIGTVCERVVRRANIDTLVIKSPTQAISKGPIVAAIDGSAQAYGGLLTALSLAQEWQVPLHVVSAFDPYYHYVAFNRIADVLSEEAGKVFHFKEQERLHEEIIDSGLAKIYDGHLQIASDIAADYGVPIETKLLDGKPHDIIGRYVRDLNPSLLVIGKLGIHADDELDIGGNAENLLRNAQCAVLLSQREYQPKMERIADVTVSWTNEAQERLQRAPSFVQNMARMAILRYAQERGHTVITERIVEEATATLMPARAEQVLAGIVEAHDANELAQDDFGKMEWSDEALMQLNKVDDLSLRDNIRLRTEKKARGDREAVVTASHLEVFLEGVTTVSSVESDQVPNNDQAELYWEAEALARLARVPEGFMRDACRERIESHARQQDENTVTLEIVESGLKIARAVMAEENASNSTDTAGSKAQQSKCPFSQKVSSLPTEEKEVSSSLDWSAEATARLEEVPAGYCRRLTQRATETIASQNNLTEVNLEFLEGVLKVFKEGSESVETSIPWTKNASARIERAPDSVRGMLVREIETWARLQGLAEVDERAVRTIKREWQDRGVFHLEPGDPRGDT